MTTTALSDRTLVHEVRLLHESTGRPLPLADPFLLRRPHGWSLRIVESRVVVVGPTGQTAPPVPPVLDVLIADGVMADLLTLPAPDPDQRRRSVRVALNAAAVDVTVQPVPMVLIVVLTLPDGSPSTGRAVSARGSSGADIPLLESGVPGTYQSAAAVWDHRYTPADLLVGGIALDRVVAVDLHAVKTRVHVVDTT